MSVDEDRRLVARGVRDCVYGYIHRKTDETCEYVKMKDIADMLDIHVNTLRSYMNGSKIPNAAIIRKMARVFNVSAEALLGLKE